MCRLHYRMFCVRFRLLYVAGLFSFYFRVCEKCRLKNDILLPLQYITIAQITVNSVTIFISSSFFSPVTLSLNIIEKCSLKIGIRVHFNYKIDSVVQVTIHHLINFLFLLQCCACKEKYFRRLLKSVIFLTTNVGKR